MAAPTALAKRTPKPAPLVAESLDTLEAEVGGRSALVAALAHAPKSQDVIFLLGLIGDPMEAATPLADLCAKGGVTAGELVAAYDAGEQNRAHAVATSKVGAKLAEVAEDTMRLSLTHWVVCGACRGDGEVTEAPTKKVPQPQPHTCKDCKGTGVVAEGGDLEHKKLALEMGKMLSKGGGVNLSVNQQVGVQVGTAGGALEKMQAITDQILYGDSAVAAPVEGEFAEVEASGEGEESSPPIDADSPIEEGDWRAP